MVARGDASAGRRRPRSDARRADRGDDRHRHRRRASAAERPKACPDQHPACPARHADEPQISVTCCSSGRHRADLRFRRDGAGRPRVDTGVRRGSGSASYSGQNVSRMSDGCGPGPSRQDGRAGRTWRVGHRGLDGRTRGERRRPVDNAYDPGIRPGRERSEGLHAPPALPHRAPPTSAGAHSRSQGSRMVRSASATASAGSLMVVPTYDEADNVAWIVRPDPGRPPGDRRARRRRRVTQTAPVRSRTTWPPPTRASPCCTAPPRRAWARPTWPVSGGRWSATTT